jgi:hypothetical protein
MIGLAFVLIGIGTCQDGNWGGVLIVGIGILWLWGYFVPDEPTDPLQR